MGDMHLDIMLSKIKERYKVDLETRTPKVPYMETIKKTARAQGKHKKQSGGRGQYGDVWFELSPLERNSGIEFIDRIVGGVVPKNYIPAAEKGLREAAQRGYLAGYPATDFSCAIYDGSYHDVDSSEMAFKIAASLAFKKAMADAMPVLIEPVMNVEVKVPEECLGDVMGDFNSRRGRIMGIDSEGKLQIVKAQCPLSEMFRYAIILRSMTSGRGTFRWNIHTMKRSRRNSEKGHQAAEKERVWKRKSNAHRHSVSVQFERTVTLQNRPRIPLLTLTRYLTFDKSWRSEAQHNGNASRMKISKQVLLVFLAYYE